MSHSFTSWNRIVGVACACWALSGCRGPASEPAPSGESDIVSQSTFATASQIVATIDYLPFQFKADGCYARALYMSMELAAQGIESNAIFAFAQPGTSLTVGNIQWVYHVAPMMGVATSPTTFVPVVVDPSIANRPLTAQEWLAAMGAGPGTPTFQMPTTLVVPGSDYMPTEAATDLAHQNLDVPNFAQMPPFRASDIQAACHVMFQYLSIEPGSPPSLIAQKQSGLVDRTVSLVGALEARAKLVDDVLFSPQACAAPNP